MSGEGTQESQGKSTEQVTFVPFNKESIANGSLHIVTEAGDRLREPLSPGELGTVVANLESDARKIGMYRVVSHLENSNVLSSEQSSELFDMYGITLEDGKRLSLPKAKRPRG